MEKNTLAGLRNICRDFIIFSSAAAVLIFVFPYLFKLLLPIILGGFLYLTARPLYNFFLKIHLPRFLSALFSLAAVFAIFGSVIWIISSQIIRELFSFSESFTTIYRSSAEAISSLVERISTLTRKSLISGTFSGGFNSIISKLGDSFSRQLSEIINSLTELLIECAKNIPNIIFVLFTAFFSAFFMLKDREIIARFLNRLLGARGYGLIIRTKTAVCGAVGCYIKAQLIIGSVIFCVLLAGFIILRVNYALLFALITAIVDAVPVLGTGTVLIPWAVFKIFSDNPTLGWGLLSLYGVCVLTRQLCEPKIIGTHLGIHPLAAIFSIYIGMRLFGIFGLILGPVAALIVKNLLISS